MKGSDHHYRLPPPSRGLLDLLARRRVLLGTLFLGLVVAMVEPHPWLWWPGLVVGILGEALRTWASGLILKNERLAQSGPYSIVRNPLYVGSFLLGGGIVLMAGNPWLILLYPCLFLPVYLRKIELEERELVARFGDEAIAYLATVPRFVPTLRTYRRAAMPWNLERVLFVHKEWINWLILAGAAGWTWWHMLGGPAGGP